jgi:hypothetical protein
MRKKRVKIGHILRIWRKLLILRARCGKIISIKNIHGGYENDEARNYDDHAYG